MDVNRFGGNDKSYANFREWADSFVTASRNVYPTCVANYLIMQYMPRENIADNYLWLLLKF